MLCAESSFTLLQREAASELLGMLTNEICFMARKKTNIQQSRCRINDVMLLKETSQAVFQPCRGFFALPRCVGRGTAPQKGGCVLPHVASLAALLGRKGGQPPAQRLPVSHGAWPQVSHPWLHPARMSVNGPALPPSSGTNCLTHEQMCSVFKRSLSIRECS